MSNYTVLTADAWRKMHLDLGDPIPFQLFYKTQESLEHDQRFKTCEIHPVEKYVAHCNKKYGLIQLTTILSHRFADKEQMDAQNCFMWLIQRRLNLTLSKSDNPSRAGVINFSSNSFLLTSWQEKFIYVPASMGKFTTSHGRIVDPYRSKSEALIRPFRPFVWATLFMSLAFISLYFKCHFFLSSQKANIQSKGNHINADDGKWMRQLKITFFHQQFN